MTAFGPFSETISVSFDRVFDGGLFLIHGRTGAGKTSILDGICFSLFGRPSSEEREKDLSTIRSDLASPDLMTECELIFAIGSSAYRVLRIPTQTKPKKRGEGFTEQKGSAELFRFDGTLSELRSGLGHDESTMAGKIPNLQWVPLALKLEAVGAAVEALIGMNERQFRQVIVLPQGRFREFLSSSSNERQAILEKLFQTDRFSRFQSALAAKSRALDSKLKEERQSFYAKLQSRGLQESEDIEPRLQEQKTQLDASRSTLEIRRSDNERLDREFHRALEFSKTLARKTELESQARIADQRRSDIEIKRKRVLQYRAWAPYFETTTLLNARVLKFNELTQSKIEIEKNQASLEIQKTSLLSEVSSEREKSPSLQELADERTRLRDSVVRLKEIDSLQKDMDQGQNRLRVVSEEVVKLNEKKIALVSQCKVDVSTLLILDESLQSAESELLKKEDHRISSLELNFHQNEVLKISERLKLGEACPVCGSKEHPKPAHKSLAATSLDVTSETVAKERARLNELKLEHAERRSLRKSQLEPYLASAVGLTSKKVDAPVSPEEFSKRIKKLVLNQNEINDVEKLLSARSVEITTRTEVLEQQRQSVQLKLSEIPSDHRKLEMVMSRGLELKAEQDRREHRQAELTAELARIEGALAHARGKISGLSDEVTRTGNEITLLKEKQNELRTSALKKLKSTDVPTEVANEKDIVKLDSEVSDFDTGQARRAAALDEILTTLKSMETARDVASIETELTHVRDEKQKLESSVARLSVEIESLESLLAESRRDLVRLDLLKNETERAVRVAALLSGDRSQNKLMVPLARFVLQSRFEDVLDQANRRLSMMSRGQFQLRRPTFSGNLRDSQGLELTVEDAIAGKERHTGSLSGGESFMAALALALGLADVVQSDLGGLRLDSVLIDEGFGTLDSESLDLALKTLVDLQTGGRFVGIISHVQELKNQVSTQLEVIKSPTGSRTQWNETNLGHASI